MVLRRLPEAGASGAGSHLPDLVAGCPELQRASGIVAAFSGGLDSSVLLSLLHDACARGRLNGPLRVLHVNHAMQAAASRWEEHCRQVCAVLGVPFSSVRVSVTPVAGESLEETARNARHAVFAAVLQAGEVLALAQHRDDQVETVLFRLLRGSGATGLAGITRARPCGKGMLLRPLLDTGRDDLLGYARARHLDWIEDGSNADQRFDRNFLRGSVLPLLYERWPGLAAAVQRSARLSGEAAVLLDELAAQDVALAAGPLPEQLRVDALLPLNAARRRNAVRYWLLESCARKAWATPTHQVLERAVSEVIPAQADAEPLLAWGEGSRAVELRRHRGLLHVLSPLPAMPDALHWTTSAPCVLPAPLGTLDLCVAKDRGLPRDRLRDVQVRFRSGGELVKPAGRPTRSLKKILQDAGVPPWLRDRVPLLYAGGELVAVADLLICEGWLADAPESRCRVAWRHPDLDCGYPPHLLI